MVSNKDKKAGLINGLFSMAGILAVGTVLGVLTFKAFDFAFPFPGTNHQKDFSQLVVDKNGLPLRAFADKKGVWRYPTKIEKVSPLYIEALINYEDRRFWQHGGVNPLSMIRAVYQWIYYRKPISGGSTLTMQVARVLEPHSKSIKGKLWQIIRATQLEWHLSKEEILNLYLNNAPFGGPIEGIEAATFTYLGKSAEHLTHAEAALLAVLPQSPSRLRPDKHVERAIKARNKVLRRMQKFEKWSPQVIEEAFQEDIFATYNTKPMIAPLLARRLKSQSPGQVLIQSTIDAEIQVAIADEVKSYLHRYSEDTSAAAMLIDNDSMAVLAYVGTAEFGNQTRFGHVDMNQAIRSPGSTLKPFIYGMALEEQLIHSHSLLQDVPLSFNKYSPENFTKQFSGPVSASDALQRSLNIPAVQLLNELGPANFSARLDSAGLKLYLPHDKKPSLSIALGGAGVKLADLVGAFRSLTQKGLAGKPRFLRNEPKSERFLLSPEAAWITAKLLSDAPLFPRQKNPFLKKEKRWLAHKTGTSYGHRDSWMVASNLKYTLAVWIGKPDGTPSPGEFGRRTAAPLVSRIFNLLPDDELLGQREPEKPKGIKRLEVCWPLGLSASITDAEHCHKKYYSWTIEGVAPGTLQVEKQVEENPLTIYLSENNKRALASCFKGAKKVKKIALWPKRLDFWLSNEFKRRALIPSLEESCSTNLNMKDELSIVGISQDSTIKQSPDSELPFELSVSVIASQGSLEWLLNGEKVAATEAEESALISGMLKGKNNLMVFNSQGQMGMIEFYVK